MNIASTLVSLRGAEDMTLEQVADKVNISMTRLSNYETGYRMPNADMFMDLVSAMGYEVVIRRKR